ncbi:hypothetical protein [Nostocoides sp. HKS02]|uniref:hypothetical protein n=1 Tax=Nostocoides sp. HKS02 TaxID=1813880 RepID=UPI0012B4E038|nr:hypothetical protein [Tetrasphaera sp. HKS02]QGN57457.1 hypothetical protein GKE56_05745 [Tetrasphaera sp. HKS02]
MVAVHHFGYGVDDLDEANGGPGHVSWVVPDLAAERARLSALADGWDGTDALRPMAPSSDPTAQETR